MEQKPLPDWDALSFRLVETDLIYRAFGDRHGDPVWQPGRFVPFSDISISPAAAFMSYGQGVFEGLKVRRTTDGRILLFRPEANAREVTRKLRSLQRRRITDVHLVDEEGRLCGSVALQDVVQRISRGGGKKWRPPGQQVIEDGSQ